MDDPYSKLEHLLSEEARLRLLSAEIDGQILTVRINVEKWYKQHDISAKADFEPKRANHPQQ